MKQQMIDLEKFDWIEGELPRLGLSHFGASLLQKPISFAHYETWLAHGNHADMSYLKNHEIQKQNPALTFAPAKSALVFAAPYLPHPERNSGFDKHLSTARVALYAQGTDYHFWFKERLSQIVHQLKIQFPNEIFLLMTDSGPILERDLAWQASLGWFGKNTCLIHPKKGSLFLIGEILTSLEIKSKSAPLPDFCGTCQKCIEICPTDAIGIDKKLDARKCISYWTIESREVAPENLRTKFGDWLFGCDLCQTICPWNQKVFGSKFLQTELVISHNQANEENLIQELRWILETSGKQIEKALQGSPLLRAGPFGLKRNALIVIGNKKMVKLRANVEKFKDHEKLADLADWVLSCFI